MLSRNTLATNTNNTLLQEDFSRIFNQQFFISFFCFFDVTAPFNNLRTLKFAS